MKTADFRNDCFALFLKGKSLRAIASEKNVSRSALERWSRKESWVDQRAIYYHELRTQTLKDHYYGDVRSRLEVSKRAFDAMMIALGEIRLVAEGKMPRRAMVFKRSNLRWLSQTYINTLSAEEMALSNLTKTIEYENLILNNAKLKKS